MNSSDIRCPACGKLRKDIYNEKIICYIACIVGGLLIGMSIALGKKNRQTDFDYYYGTTSGSNSTNTILLVIGIIAAIIGIFYYVRISQKLKTWTWR
jgi:H+/Cl- antiporter ClcA